MNPKIKAIYPAFQRVIRQVREMDMKFPLVSKLRHWTAPVAVGLVFGGLIAFAPYRIAHIVDTVFWTLIMGFAWWNLRSSRKTLKQVKVLLKEMEKDTKDMEQKILWNQVSDITKIN